MDKIFDQHLIEGPIADELKTEFASKGHNLPADAKISKYNEKWRVTVANKTRYIIEDIGTSLDIYMIVQDLDQKYRRNFLIQSGVIIGTCGLGLTVLLYTILIHYSTMNLIAYIAGFTILVLVLFVSIKGAITVTKNR